jgi:hypothetical protein
MGLREDAIVKIADNINRKRRAELYNALAPESQVKKYLQSIRAGKQFDKGSKSKVWRKIAEMPLAVDRFFTKLYGAEYYKDKYFFERYAKEWKVSK